MTYSTKFTWQAIFYRCSTSEVRLLFSVISEMNFGIHLAWLSLEYWGLDAARSEKVVKAWIYNITKPYAYLL